MPEWRKVIGRTRCQLCGSFVESSWRLFIAPATSTTCWCEPCAEELANRVDEREKCD